MVRDNYDAATDYEDAEVPDNIKSRLPDELQDATIKGGETYPVTDTVRLNGPPGTGKSTQICLRVAVLIERHDVNPSDITIVTYRRELADTVKNRLMDWGVIDEDDDVSMWTTLHAACNRLIGLLSNNDRYDKNESDELGPAATSYEKYYFCDDVLDVQFYANRPWESTKGELLFKTFEYAVNNLLDPTSKKDLSMIPSYQDLLEEWPGVDVPSLWEDWLTFKEFNDLVDFHELLAEAREDQLPGDIVIMDEYHDVTPLMACVAERWIDHSDTAIVAGDPLQVVNGYQGADPRFFTERLDDIPEILLDKSWRVPEKHWQAATHLLEKEHTAPPVKREGSGDIFEHQSPTFEHSTGTGEWRVPGESIPDSPGHIVTEYIETGNVGAGRGDRSALFLARTRKQVQGVSEALDKAGIVHGAQEDLGGWTDDEVRLLNVLLKLETVPSNYLDDKHGRGLDRYSDVENGVNSVRLTPEEVQVLLKHVKARTMELSRDELEEKRKKSINPDIDDDWTVEDLAEIAKPAFFGVYTAGTAAVSELVKGGELSNGDVMRLQRAAARYEGRDGALPVKGSDSVLKTVRTLTIHGSKGAQASDIVVFDGISGTVASEMERSQETRKNEARTWYVALTRSSERLHIMRGGFNWMIPHLPGNLRERALALAADADDAADNGGVASGD